MPRLTSRNTEAPPRRPADCPYRKPSWKSGSASAENVALFDERKSGQKTVVFCTDRGYDGAFGNWGMPQMRKAAVYLRVSTQDQTTANQERELRAVADRMGCEIVHVYQDHGVSGAKGRDKRPQFD